MRPTSTTKYVTAHSTAITPSKKRFDFISFLERKKPLIEVLGLLAILATLGVYVWLGLLQKHANKINGQAVATAQESIKVGQQSADIAKDTEIRELRAYLQVGTDSVRAEGEPDNILTIRLSFTNDGQTPAHDVRAIGGAWLSPHPLKIKIDINDTTHSPVGYLCPHQTIKIDYPFPLPHGRGIWEQLGNDTYRFYVIGEVDYKDVFDVQRRLKFGISYNYQKEAKVVLGASPNTPNGVFPTDSGFESGYNFEY